MNSYIIFPSVSDGAKELKPQVLLDWQTTPPTVPGTFWAVPVQEFGCKELPPEIVTVQMGYYGEEDQLCAVKVGYEPLFELQDFNYWLGPLPEPEAPQ